MFGGVPGESEMAYAWRNTLFGAVEKNKNNYYL